MSGNEIDPKIILKEYADALMANQEENDEASDNLIEAAGRMEKHGREIARLIYDLLGERPEARND